MKKIWHMIRRESGKPTPVAISRFEINNTTIEQPTEIANIIAHNSSLDHCTERFHAFKDFNLDKKNGKLNSSHITWNRMVYLCLLLT